MNENWPFQNKCDDLADLLYCQYKYEETDRDDIDIENVTFDRHGERTTLAFCDGHVGSFRVGSNMWTALVVLSDGYGCWQDI